MQTRSTSACSIGLGGATSERSCAASRATASTTTAIWPIRRTVGDSIVTGEWQAKCRNPYDSIARRRCHPVQCRVATDVTRQSSRTRFVSDSIYRVRTIIFVLSALFSGASAFGQSAGAGQQVFVSRCASCHGSDANGGELGPAITTRVASRTDDDLRSLLRSGLPASGMPAFANLTTVEVDDLIRYV